MELDVDSVLRRHAAAGISTASFSSSSDDTDDPSLPCRTVDDILNDSDSSSPSPSSPAASFSLAPFFSHQNRDAPPSSAVKDDPFRSNCVREDDAVSVSPAASETQSLVVGAARTLTLRDNSTESDGRLGVPRYTSAQRFSSDDLSAFTSKRPPPTSSLSSRPLTSLFGGVRSSAKPGAALAAAAAASRSILTPHAAAIKSRRAMSVNLERKLSEGELFGSGNSFSGVIDRASTGSSCQGDAKLELEDDQMGEFHSACLDEKTSSSVDAESDGNTVEMRENGATDSRESDAMNQQNHFADDEAGKENQESVVSNINVEGQQSTVDDESDLSLEDNVAVPGLDSVNSEPITSTSYGDWDVVDDEDSKLADIHHSDGIFSVSADFKRIEGDSGLRTAELPDGEKDDPQSNVDQNGSITEDVTKLVEDRLAQLESERSSKKADDKSRPPKKPLELAEEFEKNQASTGLHLVEGAAAQPMRLEGVRRGSTVLGYFDIDADNLVTQNLSSQEFMLNQGSAQVLAVHHNYIAVGMSKGVVVVVPSKYSVYHPDNMDAKMLILGQQADRSQATVTSICFNLQGDLLLAGYGDGLVVFWDVPRAQVVKVISGEHKAPVVHAFFLGQDPQVSRAFKAITGDGKGLVLLHTISVTPLFGSYRVETQCCLDGQRTGTVLCAVPLLADGFGGTSSQGNISISSSNLGGKVGGVVGGYSAWKLFTEMPSLSEEGVVIFVTHKTALVVRLSPSLEVYAQLSRPEGVREGSMPYAAWKCTTQSCTSTENSPVEASEKISLLAIAWDRKVQVAKLVRSDLKFFGKWTLDSAAIGLTWLDDQMLVVFTLTGQLCLFARDGTLIHQTSYSTDRFGGEDLIAYHTYFSNIFGNPEKSYHNSLAARGASMYILGPMHLVVCRLLPWKERIQVLRKAGDWMGALNMAISLYDGQSLGVIDLPRSLHAVQEAIMPYLMELLFSYVDEVFSYISVASTSQIGKLEDMDGSQSMSSSMQSEIKEQFTRVGGVAVEFCVHIKRTDILFEEIFSKFVAFHHRDTFLELLEPYILKDMLGSLPPEIMQALVEHYNHKGWLQRVEQCVLHMDISSLDFNQVVRLCQEHGLYGALIYLFNKGLDDFRTPLEELLNVLRTSERDNITALGYRMLVYLKYCFLGLAFPPGHGTLDPSRVPSLRVELLQFLLQKSAVPKSRPVASLIPAGSYINLYYLLELDTEATLEVLRCAFVEDDLSRPKETQNDSSAEVLEAANLEVPVLENQNLILQSIIDALVHVLLIDISEGARSCGSDETECRLWPSRHDIGLVIEFIAGYVACRRAIVLKSVLSQIFEYLTSQSNGPSDDSRLENGSVKRKEKQVLSLLNVVPETDWNASYVLHLCEKAEFNQVCGLIHCMRHQYLAALDSYMKDVDEPAHAFAFINAILLHPQDNDAASFRSAVISRIPMLTNLSRECTFLLVTDHFRDESGRILSELRSHPRSLFLYLKTLIEAHLSGTLNFSFLSDAYTADKQDLKQSDVRQFKLAAYFERVSEFPKLLRNDPVEITDDIIEIYVELLCQFEPDSVLKFLESFESYRVEHCLRLCQKYGIVDGAAFLLERVGDVGTALQLTLSRINEKFMMLDAAVENIVSETAENKVAKIDEFRIMSELKEVQDIIKVLRACVGLCQRNTPRLDPEESEVFWFQLLDSFCKPLVQFEEQNKVVGNRSRAGYKDEDATGILVTWRIAKTQRGSSILKRLFGQFIKEIVEGMIRYVRLPSILSKLLADNGSQEFGDFKLTILGMLGTYGFERRILDTAKSLIEDDTFYTMSMLKKGASHGYAPRSLLCCVCNCPFNKTSSVRVFQCGHATHSQCEHQEDEMPSQSVSSGCPVCMPKKKTQHRSKVAELGLLNRPPSRLVHTQGSSSVQNPHEIDALENYRGTHQISRFDILADLRKNPRMIQIESLPQLRLAPPALYHEKVKKSTRLTAGSTSSSRLADEQKTSSSKSRQLREIKASGSSLRFPLKSKIFGKEKSRVG